MTRFELPFPSAKMPWSDHDVHCLRTGYELSHSVSEISALIGRTKGSIRNQAYKMGITTRDDSWSEVEIAVLREAYNAATHIGDLSGLPPRLGRSRTAISRKAAQLGLSDPTRPRHRKPKADRRKFKTEEERSAARSKTLRDRHASSVHPMAGKKHDAACRQRISEATKAYFCTETAAQRESRIDKAMRTKVAKYGGIAPKIERGTWKSGWREIGGKRHFFRSRWEANYARYLEWLKGRGQIVDWHYEPETFWFDAIKRGVRSYKPDFRVLELNGTKPLHEVKGWMDARSQTTLKRMAKYHPQETIILVREKDYKAIARTVGPLIGGWE